MKIVPRSLSRVGRKSTLGTPPCPQPPNFVLGPQTMRFQFFTDTSVVATGSKGGNDTLRTDRSSMKYPVSAVKPSPSDRARSTDQSTNSGYDRQAPRCSYCACARRRQSPQQHASNRSDAIVVTKLAPVNITCPYRVLRRHIIPESKIIRNTVV